MNKLMRFAVGAVAAAGLALAGCQDRSTELEEGQGGAGFEQNEQLNQDNSRLGDGKIGENNGVIDDGEGPLEENNVGGSGGADDKMGQEPGVWNDGEGPIEENPDLNRPSDTGASENVKE